MLVVQSQGYLGKAKEEGYSGYFAEDTLMAVLCIEEGTTLEAGEKLFSHFKEELIRANISTLAEFESTISDLIVKLNFPAHFSLAAGLHIDDVLYVKTVGAGQVYFRRGKKFDLLMSGDKSASGYLQEYDLAVFTTAEITTLIGQVHDIQAFVDLNPPKEIVEKMEHEEYEEEGKGFASLFVEFLSQEAAAAMPTNPQQPQGQSSISPQSTAQSSITPQPVAQPFETQPSQQTQSQQSSDQAVSSSAVHPPSIEHPKPGFQQEATIPQQTQPSQNVRPKRKFSIPFLPRLQFKATRIISIIGVIILFGILLYSVVFGYQRRMAAELQKKVDTTKESIEAKLAEAEDEALFNFDQALELIEESKAEVETLKQEVGDKKSEEVEQLSQMIEAAESGIVKRDEVDAKEFYDLALESENAQGETIYFEDNAIAILDTANNTIYVLSVENKSIDKYTASEVSSATEVALYSGRVFFFSAEEGVFEFTSSTEAKNIIPPDSDWGSVEDFEVYAANIYMLDSEQDEIYKYLVTESGYSGKNSYIESGDNLEGSVDMAIDAAIYVAFEDSVNKYLAGVPETFSTDYPEKTPQLAGIYTSPDIEQVYVWDTNVGSIYVLDKDGTYVKQIASGIIREAKGVFVQDNSAYIFDGKKLYTVPLN